MESIRLNEAGNGIALEAGSCNFLFLYEINFANLKLVNNGLS